MAEYLIQGETLTGIADAIREKTGGATALTPAQMKTAIKGISTGVTAPKTYTLKATIEGVVVTIEVVRYYKADGSQYDLISSVKADDPIEVYSNEEYVAPSVINVDGYTGTVKSGILDYGTLESAGESDEYSTYAYVADISIVNGKVSLHTSSGEGASYIAVYLDYSIVTAN